MTPSARVQASIEILDLIIESVRDNGAAADTIIANWFKTRRFAGSGDRRAVRDLIYRAIRTRGDAGAGSGRRRTGRIVRRIDACATGHRRV
jgi:16S rRNA (cytosine967-C5)-methyltransferase